MMYDALVYVHILVFVFWLGTDVAVLHLSRHMLRPDHSPQTRAVLSSAMLNIDLFPNVAVALQLPLGITLAAEGGYAEISLEAVAASWIIGGAWAVLVVYLLRSKNAPVKRVMGALDLAWRILIVLGLAAASVASFLNRGPVHQDWLALKLGVYGVLILTGIGITVLFKPFRPALEELIANGSSPRVERAISDSIRRATPLVLVLYACLVIAGFLGTVKPT